MPFSCLSSFSSFVIISFHKFGLAFLFWAFLDCLFKFLKFCCGSLRSSVFGFVIFHLRNFQHQDRPFLEDFFLVLWVLNSWFLFTKSDANLRECILTSFSLIVWFLCANIMGHLSLGESSKPQSHHKAHLLGEPVEVKKRMVHKDEEISQLAKRL